MHGIERISDLGDDAWPRDVRFEEEGRGDTGVEKLGGAIFVLCRELREYRCLGETGFDRLDRRSQILDAVWGYDYFGETRTVDVHIRQLRKKLDGFPIETVWGVGYRVDR